MLVFMSALSEYRRQHIVKPKQTKRSIKSENKQHMFHLLDDTVWRMVKSERIKIRFCYMLSEWNEMPCVLCNIISIGLIVFKSGWEQEHFVFWETKRHWINEQALNVKCVCVDYYLFGVWLKVARENSMWMQTNSNSNRLKVCGVLKVRYHFGVWSNREDSSVRLSCVYTISERTIDERINECPIDLFIGLICSSVWKKQTERTFI